MFYAVSTHKFFCTIELKSNSLQTITNHKITYPHIPRNNFFSIQAQKNKSKTCSSLSVDSRHRPVETYTNVHMCVPTHASVQHMRPVETYTNTCVQRPVIAAQDGPGSQTTLHTTAKARRRTTAYGIKNPCVFIC